jgi:hypothetical protein
LEFVRPSYTIALGIPAASTDRRLANEVFGFNEPEDRDADLKDAEIASDMK